MPLSEHEQRLLEEMERSLYQNDADFVATVGTVRGRTNYRAIVLGVLLAVVGLAVIVTGVAIRQPLIGVLGFAIMLGGVVVAITPSRRSAADEPLDFPSPASTKKGPASSAGFMDKLNERWDNRQDGRE